MRIRFSHTYFFLKKKHLFSVLLKETTMMITTKILIPFCFLGFLDEEQRFKEIQVNSFLAELIIISWSPYCAPALTLLICDLLKSIPYHSNLST